MSKIYEALSKAKRGPEEERPGRGEDMPLKAGTRTRLSEQLRDVWTQYETLHSSLGKALGGVRGKAVVFASSVEGEGTSTVLAEYGASLGSTKERRTLLVDANFRAPRLHEVFGVPGEAGLADVLAGTKDLEEVAVRLGDDHLYLLPAGTTTTSPGALVTVTRFSRFLEKAKERFALVLVDAPPIIPYAETAIITAASDGVALVIESERTKREIVIRAKTVLEEAHCRILGVVLNRRRYVIPEFLYRYL
ncbi:MAG: CpsD/CapB family tyrosine-protein kinase [Candidatus Eisenbacteria bacterium]